MINNATDDNLELAQKLILDGKIIIYPTDTLYGFGVDATNVDAINKLNQLKKRNSPLSIVVGSFNMIKKFIDINVDNLKDLKRYFPGPYTIILNNKNNILPKELTLNKNTIGVRIPKSKFIINLVNKINRPIVTTSVNIHGEKPLNEENLIYQNFKLINIFKGHVNKESKGSTIIDFTSSSRSIIRKGDIL